MNEARFGGMTYRGWLVVAAVFAFAAVFFSVLARGQSLIGGQPSRWMTQEQISACSQLFQSKSVVSVEKSVSCEDLREFVEENCK
jgi:hypothetical protein